MRGTFHYGTIGAIRGMPAPGEQYVDPWEACNVQWDSREVPGQRTVREAVGRARRGGGRGAGRGEWEMPLRGERRESCRAGVCMCAWRAVGQPGAV